MGDRVIQARRLAAAVVVGVVALILLIGLTSNFTKPEAGEIGVVRNGGPLDNHNIRQGVPNGAGNTWTGWGAATHYYPRDSPQRYFPFPPRRGGARPGAPAPGVTRPAHHGVGGSE